MNLGKRAKTRVLAALLRLEVDPFPFTAPNVKALAGGYRLRVGDYRRP